VAWIDRADAGALRTRRLCVKERSSDMNILALAVEIRKGQCLVCSGLSGLSSGCEGNNSSECSLLEEQTASCALPEVEGVLRTGLPEPPVTVCSDLPSYLALSGYLSSPEVITRRTLHLFCISISGINFFHEGCR
jgi:hypothetical protein